MKKRLSPWLLASLPLLIFLLVPCFALLFRVPPGEFLSVLARPESMRAIELSLVTTLAAAALTVALGTPVAYLLARRSFPGKRILESVIDLPMVMPPAVAGIALLIVFGRRGLLGSSLDQMGIQIAFSRAAVVLAQLFVASPFYIKSAVAGFLGVDRELEQSAAIDGASRWKVFWTVTVPLASPALIGGTILTWARALGEFGATIIFAGNFPGRTQTMPLAIYLGFEMDFSVALALSVLLLLVSFVVLVVVKGILRQRFSTP
jgi:molybdate transport system permease protein